MVCRSTPLQVLLIAAAARVAAGHGYLLEPVSRNVLKYRTGAEYSPHALQSGGAAGVQARGQGIWPTINDPGSHGLCGDPAQLRAEPASIADMEYMEASAPQHTYVAGSIVEFSVGLSTHHWGHFEFRICDRALNKSLKSAAEGQHCLNAWLLHRAPRSEACGDSFAGDCQPLNPNHPERWYLPPPKNYVGGGIWPDDELYIMRYVIPAGLVCEHCTVQWYYATGNTCVYDEDYFLFDPGFRFFQQWREPWATCASECCGPKGPGRWGEEFWNCADISVVAQASPPSTTTVVVASTSTLLPTSTSTIVSKTSPTSTTAGPIPGDYIFGDACGADGCSECDNGCQWSWPSSEPQGWGGANAACRCNPAIAPIPGDYIFGDACGADECSDCNNGCQWSWPSNEPQGWGGSNAACRCNPGYSKSTTTAPSPGDYIFGDACGAGGCSDCDNRCQWSWPSSEPQGWAGAHAACRCNPEHGEVRSGDVVYLKAHTGKHIEVEDHVVQARWTDHGIWQGLRIENEAGGAIHSGNVVILTAHTMKMLEVESETVKARFTDRGDWQKFVIQSSGGGTIREGDIVFLKAHTGKFIHVEGTAVGARWYEQGLWQSLTLEKKYNRLLGQIAEVPAHDEVSTGKIGSSSFIVPFIVAGLVLAMSVVSLIAAAYHQKQGLSKVHPSKETHCFYSE